MRKALHSNDMRLKKMASSSESEQYTHSRISNCPEYYRLADGRPFWLFSATDLTTLLWSHGIVGWPYHCAISALEHLFRMGVKEGEAETDMESFQWWWHDVPDTLGRRKAYDLVILERRKLGR